MIVDLEERIILGVTYVILTAGLLMIGLTCIAVLY